MSFLEIVHKPATSVQLARCLKYIGDFQDANWLSICHLWVVTLALTIPLIYLYVKIVIIMLVITLLPYFNSCHGFLNFYQLFGDLGLWKCSFYEALVC